MGGCSLQRCPWGDSHPLYVEYHDREWGVPIHDDRALFEALALDGAQAGLSWLTILKKRERYRLAFSGFDPRLVARFDDRRIEQLLTDDGIVRNRLKIHSAIANARAFLAVQEKFGSFNEFVWRFVDGSQIQNVWRCMEHVPATAPRSDALSVELKRRGFSFVGSTICYAFMQAVGMVNDHLVDCFRHSEVQW